MSLLREYIRALLEFSVKANRKNVHQDGTSKSRGYMSGIDKTWTGEDTNDHLHSWYVKMGLMEEGVNHNGIMVPAPPPVEQRLKELEAISSQYANRYNDPSVLDMLDENMEKAFDVVVMTIPGAGSHMDLILNIKAEILPAIKHHKEHFGTPRPYELAAQYEIPFEYDKLETAQTPSYPSGHTAQAYYTAIKLSAIFPQLEDQLFTLAKMIEESRLDRGVHFPSDNTAGIVLAQQLAGLEP
tara:strand:+ start:424 stop:1146 length:723 start_codon:yes stop_codon:yes gene_type:complete